MSKNNPQDMFEKLKTNLDYNRTKEVCLGRAKLQNPGGQGLALIQRWGMNQLIFLQIPTQRDRQLYYKAAENKELSFEVKTDKKIDRYK